MAVEDTPWRPPLPVVGIPGSSPAFGEMYTGALKAKWRQHMRGKEHVGEACCTYSGSSDKLTEGRAVWQSLFVKPEWQRRGIGSALLRWGFAEFGLEKQLVWLTTQMRGRNIYRKYGWVDVEYVDVDLSEWGGRYRGFGIHRSPLMLRQPGELKEIEGIVEE
jgi:GNAT superfamily N-acetyltransferase